MWQRGRNSICTESKDDRSNKEEDDCLSSALIKLRSNEVTITVSDYLN